MKADDISRETIFEILVMFIRINKKFDRIEGHGIDVEMGLGFILLSFMLLRLLDIIMQLMLQV